MTVAKIYTSPISPALDEERSFFRLGLIVLATDLTTEHDFRRICVDPAIRIHVSRTFYRNPVTTKNLLALKDGLSNAASLLPPDIHLQAVYFSCTSAGALLGDETVEEKIQSAVGPVPVITPLFAAREALRSLQVKNISLLTPYTAEVAGAVGDYFTQHAFNLRNITCMGLEDDRVMARIQPDSIIEAAKEALAADAEALFISCTALRSAEVVSRIEEETGRPVVTSNQAAAWKCLQLTHAASPLSDWGRVFFGKGNKR